MALSSQVVCPIPAASRVQFIMKGVYLQVGLCHLYQIHGLPAEREFPTSQQDITIAATVAEFYSNHWSFLAVRRQNAQLFHFVKLQAVLGTKQFFGNPAVHKMLDPKEKSIFFEKMLSGNMLISPQCEFISGSDDPRCSECIKLNLPVSICIRQRITQYRPFEKCVAAH